MTINEKIKIVFADIYDLYRKSMSALVNGTHDLKMVGEAHNETILLQLLKKKRPDILIITRKIQFTQNKRGLHSIREKFPQLKIIVLSDTTILVESLDLISGANCYLSTSCPASVFFKAIRSVSHKGYFFDHSDSKNSSDSILLPNGANVDLHPFNDREGAILKGICDGKTNKEIANALHLSISTVDFYRTRIYTKTKCNNGVTLLKYALKRGIITLN